MARLSLWLCLGALSGCFYIGRNDFEDVVRRWPEEWSTRDCLTIILGVTQHNLLDPRSPDIKVVAIPYYPCVIAAIQRREHILGPLQLQPFTYARTEEMFRRRLDTAMALEAGVYVDWATKRYVDSRGNYLREPTQLDSLMFYVSVSNANWPGVPPEGVPDITNLEEHISLVNDRDESIQPKYVWGKQRTHLTIEEKLLMMFVLRRQDQHFLSNSSAMRMKITGFQDTIVLQFPISRIK